MTSERDIRAASPTQEPLSQRISDSGVSECAYKAFLLTDIQSDHPSDIGENTLMAIPEDSQKSFSSESAPTEGEDQITTPKEGGIVVNTSSEELLRVCDSIINLEGGALETLASDMKVDVCKGSGSSDSQFLIETSSLHIFEDVPLHQDASGDEANFLFSNPLSIGTMSAHPTLSDTVQIYEKLAADQAKG